MFSQSELESMIREYRIMQSKEHWKNRKDSIEVTIQALIDFFNLQTKPRSEWKNYPYPDSSFYHFKVKIRRAEMLVDYFKRGKRARFLF